MHAAVTDKFLVARVFDDFLEYVARRAIDRCLKIFEQFSQLPESSFSPRSHRRLIRLHQPFDDRPFRSIIPLEKFRQAHCADAALWHIDDTLKTHAIIRLVEQSEVRQHVFDNRPIQKTQSADNFIRNITLPQCPLHRIALRIGAIQYRHITIRSPRTRLAMNFLGDHHPLFGFTIRLPQFWRHAAANVRPKILVGALGIVLN